MNSTLLHSSDPVNIAADPGNSPPPIPNLHPNLLAHLLIQTRKPNTARRTIERNVERAQRQRSEHKRVVLKIVPISGNYAQGMRQRLIDARSVHDTHTTTHSFHVSTLFEPVFLDNQVFQRDSHDLSICSQSKLDRRVLFHISPVLPSTLPRFPTSPR